MTVPPLTATNLAALIAAFKAANAPVPVVAGGPAPTPRKETPRSPDSSPAPARPAPHRPLDLVRPAPVRQPGSVPPDPGPLRPSSPLPPATTLVRQAMLAELLDAVAPQPSPPVRQPGAPPGDAAGPEQRPPAPASPPEPADPIMRAALARLVEAARDVAKAVVRLPYPTPAGVPANSSPDPAPADPGAGPPTTPDISEPAGADGFEDIRLAARRALDAAYLKAAGGERLGAALLAREAPEAVLAELERGLLFAVATGPENLFGKPERRAALGLLYRQAAAILWPDGQGGEVAPERLHAYAADLDAAGPQERQSVEWRIERAAAQIRLDGFVPAASADDGPTRGQSPAVALIKSAIEAVSAGLARTADPQPAGAVVLRETPLIASGFLSQEMLLAALAAARRADAALEAPPDAPSRRRLARRVPLAGVRFIRPLAAEWRDVGEAVPLVEAWEALSGVELPEDYRRFIVAFDGGHLYPNLFDVVLPGERFASAGRLERLHDFETAADCWRDAPGDDGRSKLRIGQTADGAAILLSLAREDFGAVLIEWNSAEAPVAPDFGAFIDGLGDDADLSSFRVWDRPALRRLVRRLVY